MQSLNSNHGLWIKRSISKEISACLINFFLSYYSRMKRAVISLLGWLPRTLADDSCNAAKPSASSAASARRDVYLVHYFPFPNNWPLFHLRDPIWYCYPCCWEILISLGYCRPRHKSVWQKYPILFFAICWNKLIPFINVDYYSVFHVDVRLGICLWQNL